jgi:cytidine deaminase
MKRGGFSTGSYEHHLQDGFDPHHAFVALMPRFVELAREAAQKQAVSYRHFRVGAVMYAGNQAFSTVATIDGANHKPHKAHPKHCAEMSVIDQAEALGLSTVLGVIVAGTSDPEKIKAVNGRATRTLHPCAECRDRMVQSGLFKDESLIITVSTEEDVYEVRTHSELQEYWRQEPEEAIEAPVTYNLTQWPWRQLVYGRNMAEVPDSQPWSIAKLALEIPVVPVPETV